MPGRALIWMMLCISSAMHKCRHEGDHIQIWRTLKVTQSRVILTGAGCQCNYSHNMDIETFLVNMSIFIKHFFNMATRALKNLSRTGYFPTVRPKHKDIITSVLASPQPDALKILLQWG